MSLRLYLILMGIGTLICWFAWGFVLFTISPSDALNIGPVFFYLTLFMALVGSCSILGFAIRRKIVKNDDVVFRHVRHTFRQSLLIAAFIIACLMLQATHWLAWWNAVLIALALYLLETIVFAGRKFNNNVSYGQ